MVFHRFSGLGTQKITKIDVSRDPEVIFRSCLIFIHVFQDDEQNWKVWGGFIRQVSHSGLTTSGLLGSYFELPPPSDIII